MDKSDLTPLRWTILRTWKISRPIVVARMKCDGTLYEAINEAAEEAAQKHENLFKQGIPPLQAQELARELWQSFPDDE